MGINVLHGILLNCPQRRDKIQEGRGGREAKCLVKPSSPLTPLLRNSIWGSNLTANLSRINQAYYMGVYEYLGLGYDHDDVYIDEIRKIDRGLVLRTARRYFDTKNYAIATAGNMEM